MKDWVRQGLGWGLCMFIFMNIIFPLIDGDFGVLDIVIGIPLWTVAGLIFGYAVFGWGNSKTQIKMKKWVRSGLVWGGILYIITMIIFPLFGRESLTLSKIILGIPLWIIVGLTIGYLFKRKKV